MTIYSTSGPLCVSVQVLGHVPRSSALLRSGGRVGDAVFVSGFPGDAGAGLAIEQGRLPAAGEDAAYLRERFLYPAPRVALGECLRRHASACIDVSDGLLADAGKLARASGCGVEIGYEEVPVSEALERVAGAQRARELALTGGDDYELCFTVRPAQVGRLLAELPPQRWGYTRIGTLREVPGAEVLRDGAVMSVSSSGYDHFSHA